MLIFQNVTFICFFLCFVIWEALWVSWGKLRWRSPTESSVSAHNLKPLPSGSFCADEEVPFLNLVEILYKHWFVVSKSHFLFFLSNCWTKNWSTNELINQNWTFCYYVSPTRRTVPCMIVYRLWPFLREAFNFFFFLILINFRHNEVIHFVRYPLWTRIYL